MFKLEHEAYSLDFSLYIFMAALTLLNILVIGFLYSIIKDD